MGTTCAFVILMSLKSNMKANPLGMRRKNGSNVSRRYHAEANKLDFDISLNFL